MLKLPGLIDPHVHMREPGATHKEDWDTGTSAALAGGYTLVLAMPNTQPPLIDLESFQDIEEIATAQARCDYGLYLGATRDLPETEQLLDKAVGLKMYLNQTFGPLRLDDMEDWMKHFARWPSSFPIAAHAERHTLGAVIAVAALYHHPVHICHVSRRDEILLIRKAKEEGLPVTCEVTPHHLFLSEEDVPRLGQGRSQVRPDLASKADQQALWDNLDVIDCFATDHAPHLLAEKDAQNPPPGFPGLETAIALLFNAVSEGRLTQADILERCCINPQRIFHLPPQPDTWTEIDPDVRWEIKSDQMYSRSAWTPVEGCQVQGKVRRVVLRGKEVYRDGQVLAQPGYGRNIRILNHSSSI
jgi:carbamoyl-phosphate synthase/aspartate carbamoyltransferase/dihydroorotase